MSAGEGVIEPYVEGDGFRLYVGDSIEIMARMPERSVDAIVTDPPYG